jgi:uncharacterized protein (TIGR02246 family)
MSATAVDLTAVRDLTDRYGAAWNAHDVDALLSMQSPDMAFHLHVEGFGEVRGAEALREQFAYFFTVMPDYAAGLTRTRVSPDLVVLEYVITATLAGPFPVGPETGVPTGTPMRFEAVDLLAHAGGVFTRKDTYVDGFAMRRGLGL